MSFENFIRYRQYITNVSPLTLEWYRWAFHWLTTETPSQIDLQNAVVRMREHGVAPVTVNGYIRVFNAYCHWLTTGGEVKYSTSCKHPKVSKLVEEINPMPVYSAEQVKLLIHYRPQTHLQRRLHLLVLFLFDTGARISEALSVKAEDADLDNLLVRLNGKGRKLRIVPFSVELRKS